MAQVFINNASHILKHYHPVVANMSIYSHEIGQTNIFLIEKLLLFKFQNVICEKKIIFVPLIQLG